MDDLDLGSTIKGFAAGQKVFNRYTLKKFLGRGGMGVVWLVRDEELGRDSAIKFLPEIVATDRASIDDMKREVRRAIDLAHPHIIKTHDFITDGRTAGVSMEFIPGGTLSALRLDEPDKVLTVERLAPWVKQLCDALDYAHETGEVVHRDLKPTNLMLDAKGRLKIVDFGIAASISDSVSRVSQQAGSSGTPVYMSPQQMMGEDPAVTDDVYAVGATLYELLTGKPPFHSGNILLQVQNKVAPPLNERRKTLDLAPVPDEWEQTIAACLAKDFADRPQSARAIAERLSGVKPATRVPVATPTPVVPAPSEPLPAPIPPAGGPQVQFVGAAKTGMTIGAMFVVPVLVVAIYNYWGTHDSDVGGQLLMAFQWWLGLSVGFGVLALLIRLAGGAAATGAPASGDRPKISGARRWLLAPLAWAALPTLAVYLFVAQLEGNCGAFDSEAMLAGGACYMIASLAAMILVRVLVSWQPKRSHSFSAICAALGALIGLGLGWMADAPAPWIIVCTGVTGLVWAISGHWMHRLTLGRPAGAARDFLAHPLAIIATFFVVQAVFGRFLPDAINEVKDARRAQYEKNAHDLAERERLAQEQRDRKATAARIERERQAEAARLQQAAAAKAEQERLAAEHLAAARGGIVVRTNPSGAEVRVGAVALDKAPLTLKDQKLGKYPVRVRLDGYEDWIGEVEVKENEFADLDVDLVRSTGRVVLTGTAGATVSAEGISLGVLPLTLDRVPTGPVRYSVARQGYKPTEVSGSLARNGELRLVADLARQPVPPRKGQPWENTLGQKFVPIPGQGVLVCIWETRVQDFEAFVRETGYDATADVYTLDAAGNMRQAGGSWRAPGYVQTGLYPVSCLNQADAEAFCRWLTQKEQAAGVLRRDQVYRLPTDDEWEAAVGGTYYPWGNQWPPPPGAGNFADRSMRAAYPAQEALLEGYVDGFAAAAPVGSFAPSVLGLYDLGGNLWERVGDRADGIRGASFLEADQNVLIAPARRQIDANTTRDVRTANPRRNVNVGFRLVVAVGAGTTN